VVNGALLGWKHRPHQSHRCHVLPARAREVALLPQVFEQHRCLLLRGLNLLPQAMQLRVGLALKRTEQSREQNRCRRGVGVSKVSPHTGQVLV